MSENGTNLPDSADIDLNTDIAAMLDADNPDFDAVMESIKDVGPINAQMDPMAASNPPMENAIDFGAQVMQPIKTKEEIERERMNLLVSHFDEQQMARYAAFRRANIRRASVKRYASQLLSQPISNNVAVVLAGMSKVLIGDVIELARDLQEKDLARERSQQNLPEPSDSEEPEPLLPIYIREAWRIYKKEQGTVPGSRVKPGNGGRLF